jgi:hypothetical protein
MKPERLRDGLSFLHEFGEMIDKERGASAQQLMRLEGELSQLQEELRSAINDEQQQRVVPDPTRFNDLRLHVLPALRAVVEKMHLISSKLLVVQPLAEELFASRLPPLVEQVPEASAVFTTTVIAPVEPSPDPVEPVTPPDVLSASEVNVNALLKLTWFRNQPRCKKQVMLAFLFYGERHFLCEEFSPRVVSLLGGSPKLVSNDLRAATKKQAYYAPLLQSVLMDEPQKRAINYFGRSVYLYSITVAGIRWAKRALTANQDSLGDIAESAVELVATVVSPPLAKPITEPLDTLQAVVELGSFKELTQARQLVLIAYDGYARQPFLCEDFSPRARLLTGNPSISEVLSGAVNPKKTKIPFFRRLPVPTVAHRNPQLLGGTCYQYILEEHAAIWAEATLKDLRAEIDRSQLA